MEGGAGELADLAADGGGEEHRLPDLRQPLEDLGELGLEPHVEHPVGLVEDEDLDLVELRGALLEVVDEPARRRDDHLVVAELRGLVPHPDAADDDGAADVARLAEALELLGDLERQLARRREDERASGPGAGAGRQPLDDREEERGGLAGPGGGDADDVLARERGRDGLRLDGRGGLEPGAGEGGERLLGELQVGKGGQGVRAYSPLGWPGTITRSSDGGRRRRAGTAARTARRTPGFELRIESRAMNRLITALARRRPRQPRLAASTPEEITFEATRAGSVKFPHKLHAARGCRSCHPAAPGKLGLDRDKAHELCKGMPREAGEGPDQVRRVPQALSGAIGDLLVAHPPPSRRIPRQATTSAPGSPSRSFSRTLPALDGRLDAERVDDPRRLADALLRQLAS